MSEKNQIPQEIIDWARQNSSARLRKGLEANYPMIPLIFYEWIEAHYPGFMPDIDNLGRWKSSDCPSLKALQLEAKYAAGEHIEEAHVVMATLWPWLYEHETDQVLMCTVPQECLVVRDDRIPYDLVMPVE